MKILPIPSALIHLGSTGHRARGLAWLALAASVLGAVSGAKAQSADGTVASIRQFALDNVTRSFPPTMRWEVQDSAQVLAIKGSTVVLETTYLVSGQAGQVISVVGIKNTNSHGLCVRVALGAVPGERLLASQQDGNYLIPGHRSMVFASSVGPNRSKQRPYAVFGWLPAYAAARKCSDSPDMPHDLEQRVADLYRQQGRLGH